MNASTVSRSVRDHWREYLIEALLLGLFMVSAGAFAILLEYPGSPIHAWIPNSDARRLLMGLAMGATAVGLILSPAGKRSGAHMNPAVTLAFLRLGKVQRWDAVFYVLAQFAGGIVGVALVAGMAPHLLSHASIGYVATVPGQAGPVAALLAEFGIAFVMMLTVLWVGNTPKLARWTPFFAGTLVMLFITFEAPFSGMSMNPARSFGSAFVGQIWTHLWIYFLAPVAAMQLAAWIYSMAGRAVYCAKLHHHNNARCIFNCAFGELSRKETEQGATLISTVASRLQR